MIKCKCIVLKNENNSFYLNISIDFNNNYYSNVKKTKNENRPNFKFDFKINYNLKKLNCSSFQFQSIRNIK